MTERRPVSPDEVVLARPTALEVVVSSCMGDPLDGRTVIDLVTGETLSVRPLDADLDPLGASPEDLPGRSFVSTNVMVDGELYQLVSGPLAVPFDSDDADGVPIRWEAGCNISGGWFDVALGRIEPRRPPNGASAFESTTMDCERQEHEQDEWFDDVFAEAPVWELDGDTLLLERSERPVVLGPSVRLLAQSLAPPAADERDGVRGRRAGRRWWFDRGDPGQLDAAERGNTATRSPPDRR